MAQLNNLLVSGGSKFLNDIQINGEILSRSDAGNNFLAKATSGNALSNDYGIALAIGGGHDNRGLWNPNASKWLLYTNGTDNIAYFQGNSNKYISVKPSSPEIGVYCPASNSTTSGIKIHVNANGNGGFYHGLTSDWLIRFSNLNSSTKKDVSCYIPPVWSQSVSGTAVMVNSSGQIGKSSSSRRYKENILDLKISDIKDFFNLPVRTFRYKAGHLINGDELIGKQIPGFIAEEVNKILPEAVIHDGEGRPEMWNQNVMIPIMMKMIQENHKEITELKQELKKIKGET